MLSVCLVLKPAEQIDWRSSREKMIVFSSWAYETYGLQTLTLFSCLLNCSDETTQHSNKLQYTCLRLIL